MTGEDNLADLDVHNHPKEHVWEERTDNTLNFWDTFIVENGSL